jgi:DNA (cytosine-5)-methyltransferase 1
MRYGSVCSGIEAATVAWHGLGWEPAFFSEIEKFPREVLAHHYPDVPLHGDFTTIGENQYGSIDLLVGGTPCQSFSVAGLRKGLDDDRGNLSLEFIKLAQRNRPRWVVWENVPGVLSSNGGRDFGSFLSALGQSGYGFAYRVLDAQYFGVAQRRRRVFVVGYLGDWRRAAAVLFERESLRGNPAPSREKGQKPAPTVTAGPPFSRTENDRVEADAYIPSNVGSLCARTCQSISTQDADQGHLLTARMRGFGDYDCDGTASTVKARDYKDATDLVAAFQQTADCLTSAYGTKWNGNGSATNGSLFANHNMAVRRLTPTECERLQGFPDGYTNIKDKCPDGPRYKALGNSMAVPVMKWIGERIQMVEDHG